MVINHSGFHYQATRIKRFDSILVVVDRLSKMAHFIACHESITAEQTAYLLLSNVFKLHDLPDEIISDRGPQFISKFWDALLKRLGVQRKLSSSRHPQTDGQTERVNQTLEQYLRCFISYRQDDWDQLLPLAEFSYNNAEHASARMSPFLSNYGFHPRFDTTPGTSTTSNCPTAQERIKQLDYARIILK